MKALLNWFKTLRARVGEIISPQPRVVPHDYIAGCHRRLANNAQQIEDNKGKCFSCRHAVAFQTWWCERIHIKKLSCEWAPCYHREEITPRDLKAGSGLVCGWRNFPPEQKDRTPAKVIPITQDLTETRVKE